MSLIYFILVCYGLTQILVYGSIFNEWRPTKGFFGDMLKCPMCSGFWVGSFVFLISPWTELITFEYSLINMLICGWLSSGTSYVFCTLFGDEGINVKGN
tara:strand:+ start:5590 stop:5886 length:297 start_codon:yes stop_codon:yes gene_type:complete